MIEIQLYDFAKLFFVALVITAGYGYLIVAMFIKSSQETVLQLLCLTGLSAFFSFVVFRDTSMWNGSPSLVLAIVTGVFTATVIFYMLYFIIILAFSRAGSVE
ncbi:hypothetical protein CE841_004235 [Salmonella enterica]|nr:hypothetical protein [Salmonella enterica]ECE6504319.1 hypothetical protein [Salmonella enterica subsp. salamae]EDQ7941399.1 hypothetical protein [Salmonella enterica]MEI04915.1 hypothetical protein [Salmonella enterica]MJG41611.1 hypothetical protein [Salmonella enterica subsp. salamae]